MSCRAGGTAQRRIQFGSQLSVTRVHQNVTGWCCGDKYKAAAGACDVGRGNLTGWWAPGEGAAVTRRAPLRRTPPPGGRSPGAARRLRRRRCAPRTRPPAACSAARHRSCGKSAAGGLQIPAPARWCLCRSLHPAHFGPSVQLQCGEGAVYAVYDTRSLALSV